MGLTKGSEIYIEKYAPLKDPLELVVRGCHVSLRVREAAEIDVEAVHPAGKEEWKSDTCELP
jgi:Fur family ferric uptake transcriptional regulator